MQNRQPAQIFASIRGPLGTSLTYITQQMHAAYRAGTFHLNNSTCCNADNVAREVLPQRTAADPTAVLGQCRHQEPDVPLESAVPLQKQPQRHRRRVAAKADYECAAVKKC